MLALLRLKMKTMTSALIILVIVIGGAVYSKYFEVNGKRSKVIKEDE